MPNLDNHYWWDVDGKDLRELHAYTRNLLAELARGGIKRPRDWDGRVPTDPAELALDRFKVQCKLMTVTVRKPDSGGNAYMQYKCTPFPLEGMDELCLMLYTNVGLRMFTNSGDRLRAAAGAPRAQRPALCLSEGLTLQCAGRTEYLGDRDWCKRGVYGPWTMAEIVITCEIPLRDPNGNARDDVEIEILASKEMQHDMLTRQGSGWKHRWSRRWRANF
jgi:hypothetical protein